MNSRKILMVCLLLFLSLSACSNKNVEKQSLQKSTQGKLGNAMRVENVHIEMQLEHPTYKVKADKLVLQIKNKGEPLTYGPPYEVEIFKEGYWYKIPLRDDVQFTMIGITIPSGRTNEETISLSSLKYKLVPGQYRVIKRFYGEDKEIILASTFELN
ncbi:MAG: immunoglobulin-like domain-containing protein [Bacillaceae bacterium]